MWHARCQDIFDKVASKLSFVCGESAANKERSCCIRAIIAATKLNSQRPFRREVTRRKSCLASRSPRINNAIPIVVSTSKAVANKANKRDHASISLTRASAKPRYLWFAKTSYVIDFVDFYVGRQETLGYDGFTDFDVGVLQLYLKRKTRPGS